MRERTAAFSLLELLVTLAIIAILIAIAYPNYRNYIIHTNRERAIVALTTLASRLEIYFGDNNTYTGVTAADLGADNLTRDIPYQLSIVDASDNEFMVAATPQNNQATDDVACETLMLTNANVRGISGDGSTVSCWR